MQIVNCLYIIYVEFIESSLNCIIYNNEKILLGYKTVIQEATNLSMIQQQ